MNTNTTPSEGSTTAVAGDAPRYRYADHIRGSGSGVMHLSYKALEPDIE